MSTPTGHQTKIGLYTGKVIATPASSELMEAFRSAHIESSDSGQATFALTFQLARNSTGSNFTIYDNSDLTPYSRIIMTASIDAQSQILIDGLITSVDTQPGTGNNPDTITVKGSDLSAAMQMHEKSIPWPCMPDFAIVMALLAQYAFYGIIPIAIPTIVTAAQTPGMVTKQQSSTDYDYIMQLAQANGYIFRVIPGLTPGQSFAYFGPPLRAVMRFVAPQCKTLNLAPTPMGNVQKMNFSVNAEAPEMWGGMVLDVVDQDSLLVPVASVVPLLPPFAMNPALPMNLPWVKFKLLEKSKNGPLTSLALIQGRTDLSAGKYVTAQGTVDVERYRSMLSAPGIVSIRGAGTHHDGKYCVTHLISEITPESFKQTFTLNREGTVSNITMVS